MNLATGESRASLDFGEVEIGTGSLSPDGRFYFSATALGIAKFRTVDQAFLGLFGPSLAARHVAVSPSGSWVHVVTRAPERYLILDSTTGAVVSERTFDVPTSLVFTNDGAYRLEIRAVPPEAATITAYADAPDAAPIWQRTIDTHIVAAGTRDLAYTVSAGGGRTDVVVANAATGDERGRFGTGSVYGLAIHESTLLISSIAPSEGSVFYPPAHLIRADLTTLTTSVLSEFPFAWMYNSPQAVAFSSDGTIAYWQQFVSFQGVTVSRTLYKAVEVATGDVLATGTLNPQIALDFDVEPGTPCVFHSPATTSVDAEGGIVDIAVQSQGPCPSWTVPAIGDQAIRIINPGPHSSSTVLHAAVSPTLSASSRTLRVAVPGNSVEVVQAGALPAAPRVEGRVSERRLTLTWTPSRGPAHNGFAVRGSVIGSAPVQLATLDANARSWTSTPLPAGEYQVRVAASNEGGPGEYSDPLQFSVGLTAIPEAPVGLEASAVDGAVALRWSPPAAGPRPAGYEVEAAPAGATSFLPVGRVFMPYLDARGVPSGTWTVRVRAVTEGGPSQPSNPALVNVAACTAPPDPPIALISAGTTPLDRVARLYWTAPARGAAENYVLEAGSISGGSDLGRLLSRGSGLMFELAAPSGIYFVRVRATNRCGESPASNEAVVFVP